MLHCEAGGMGKKMGVVSKEFVGSMYSDGSLHLVLTELTRTTNLQVSLALHALVTLSYRTRIAWLFPDANLLVSQPSFTKSKACFCSPHHFLRRVLLVSLPPFDEPTNRHPLYS